MKIPVDNKLIKSNGYEKKKMTMQLVSRSLPSTNDRFLWITFDVNERMGDER